MDMTISGRYKQLAANRHHYIETAELCSALTLPAVFPDEEYLNPKGNTRLEQPHQSIGALGVNNLASKLMLSLFPASVPFFEFSISDRGLQQLSEMFIAQQMGVDDISEIEDDIAPLVSTTTGQILIKLAEARREVTHELIQSGLTRVAGNIFKHLIITGNALVAEDINSGELTVYSLRDFVVRRDPTGNLLELITREQSSVDGLSEEAREFVRSGRDAKDCKNDDVIDIYTHCKLVDGEWKFIQELDKNIWEETERTFEYDALPFTHVTWNLLPMEHYGRGHIEDLLADLQTADGYAQAMMDITSAMAFILTLVDPSGATDIASLEGAENMTFLSGRSQDVGVLSMAEKRADMSEIRQASAEITSVLRQQFLMNSAVQRNAERVTKAEIRYVAQQLEDMLGGVYTQLAHSLQLPLVRMRTHRMVREGKLNDTFKAAFGTIIDANISTGFDALGRSHEADNLLGLLTEAAGLMGAEQLAMRMNIGEALNRLASYRNIDLTDLIKSDEQMQAEAQEAQMAQAGQQLGPEVIKQVGQMLQNEQKLSTE